MTSSAHVDAVTSEGGCSIETSNIVDLRLRSLQLVMAVVGLWNADVDFMLGSVRLHVRLNGFP